MDLRLDISWRLGLGDLEPVGKSLFQILKFVDTHGSLSSAAKAAGVSYRSAWNLVNTWSVRLGQPLVIMQRGRGATLSPLGRKLVQAENRAVNRVSSLLSDLADELKTELEQIPAAALDQPATVFASHCLTHDILRKIFRDYAQQELILKNAGSAKSLAALAQGRCDAAGFHLVSGDLRPRFIEHYLNQINPADYTLIYATTRRQGLIVAPGNPKNIQDVTDLVKKNVRLVNRQEHSGTRLLLDALLDANEIAASRITGYHAEEFTHSAVSALVASGAVDVGVGTEAYASQFGLDYIHLASEEYYYAVASENLLSPPVASLSAVLAGQPFRQKVRALPGYNPTGSGRRLAAQSIIS